MTKLAPSPVTATGILAISAYAGNLYMLLQVEDKRHGEIGDPGGKMTYTDGTRYIAKVGSAMEVGDNSGPGKQTQYFSAERGVFEEIENHAAREFVEETHALWGAYTPRYEHDNYKPGTNDAEGKAMHIHRCRNFIKNAPTLGFIYVKNSRYVLFIKVLPHIPQYIMNQQSEDPKFIYICLSKPTKAPVATDAVQNPFVEFSSEIARTLMLPTFTLDASTKTGVSMETKAARLLRDGDHAGTRKKQPSSQTPGPPPTKCSAFADAYQYVGLPVRDGDNVCNAISYTLPANYHELQGRKGKANLHPRLVEEQGLFIANLLLGRIKEPAYALAVQANMWLEWVRQESQGTAGPRDHGANPVTPQQFTEYQNFNVYQLKRSFSSAIPTSLEAPDLPYNRGENMYRIFQRDGGPMAPGGIISRHVGLSDYLKHTPTTRALEEIRHDISHFSTMDTHDRVDWIPS